MVVSLAVGAVLLAAGVPAAAQQVGAAEDDEAIVQSLRQMSSMAFADAIVDQKLVGNTLVESGVNRRAVIENSFNGTHGLIGANQSSGELNNQANVQAIGIVSPNGGDEGGGTVHVQDADHVIESRGNDLTTSGSRTALIENSFNDTSGIAAVNQAAGSMNQQANVVVLTLGGGAGPDATLMGDTGLAGVVVERDNELDETEPVPKEQGVRNSFNNFSGIAQVSSIAGDLNSVSNLMSVSVRTVGSR